MRRLPASTLLCVAAASCGDPLAPLPGRAPRELTYVVHAGLLGVTFDVRLAGDTVVVLSRGVGSGRPAAWETRRVPTAEEWREFGRLAGAAGVRRWPTRCTDDRLADAGGFAFTLAWGAARFAGSYYALSPTAGGRCSDADRDDAHAFGRAVLALAGFAEAH